MKSTRQAGIANLLVIPLVLLVIVLIGVSAFAFTAYSQAQAYKNNVDQKVAVAVQEAEQQISERKDKDYAEREKFPYDTYVAPEAAGSLRLQYPKTWSGYVVAPTGRTTNKPVDGFFHPGQVPSTTDANNSFALRVVVEQKTYESIMKSFQNQQKDGRVSIQPYQSGNVAGVIGSRVDGEVKPKKQGSMIVMPFRDKTLQIWTESTDFRADFDNIILKNFVFTP
jgi:type II secretory pathway pseudopilin PulG